MGRDELNLAEFPLAALADRVGSGKKTLAFEDRIWDRGRGRHVTRRLTISGSDQYGLPTALDDEVVVGLVQLTKAADFASRCVNFSRYELIRILGWRDEGRSYRRVEESLKRWLGVTLYYDNAWWDKQQQRWVAEHFHILEHVLLLKPKRGRRKDGQQELPLSSFTWNERVFQSFDAGYLKQLDMEVYRRLRLAVSKRMYRFLDKRFHFSRQLSFDLHEFAFEHIGLSRCYDAAQLRRRLERGMQELEGAGFLEAMAPKARYRRVGHGCWVVVVKKQIKTPGGTVGSRRLRGVVRGQYGSGMGASISSAPRGGGASRGDVTGRTPREGERTDGGEKSGDLAVSEEENIRRYLAGLSAGEVEEVEVEAVRRASPFAAAGYRRCKIQGPETTFQAYRWSILSSYLRSNCPLVVASGPKRA
jgi:hypothetical protein